MKRQARNKFSRYSVKKFSDIPAGAGKIANLFLQCRDSCSDTQYNQPKNEKSRKN
jgi:hypothetical protein